MLAGCAEAAPPPVSATSPAVPTPALIAAGAASPTSADFQLVGKLEQGALVRGRVPAGAAALTLDGQAVPVAPDGSFLLGFDRDQPAVAVLTATSSTGGPLRQELRVAPRGWKVEHVNVAQRPPGSNEDYRLRRERELARIAAARALPVESDGWRQNFVWPAKGRISGVFGSQRVYRGEPGAYHSGTDIAAGAGAPVVSPADGVVVLAGGAPFSLEGNLVIVSHGMGLNSAFLHLASVAVEEGQPVKQGQRVGAVGATGRATGPHLHWSMKWRDARIDPEFLLKPH
jgi:murein DD-endopeptidase MepM/ murein hydrolase activator NlpD